MVEFRNDGKNAEVQYSFTDFDERIGKVFETACKQLFETIKEPVLQECKTLRSIVEEVASQDEFYGDTVDEQSLFWNYGKDEYKECLERDLARKFSDFIFDFYKEECFPRGVMTKIQKLGNVGRNKIEKKLAERNDYTHFNLAFHKSFLSFEDIARFDDRSIQKIIRNINNTDLAVALKNSSDELKERIGSVMSKRAQQELFEDIEYIGPVLKRDIVDRQQKILQVMEELYSCHELAWGDDWVN